MRLWHGFYRDLPEKDQLFDYDGRTDGQPVYVGYAELGTLESGEWVIHYFEYDVNSNITRIQSRRGSWTNRAALFA